MPDLEALEVAQAALSDVNLGDEPSKDSDVKTAEQLDPDAEAEGDSEAEKESKSQRRRRMRREKEQEASQRMGQLEAENERLRQKARTLKAPNPSLYTSDAEYTADLAAYRVRSQDVQAESTRIQTDYSEASNTETGAFTSAVEDFMTEGSEKYADFREITSREPKDGGPVISTIMAEAVMESDSGIDLLYYLGSHPKEAAKIAELSPVAQARAIFQLEDKVKAQSAPPRSQAPAPIKPIRGGSAAATKPISQMNMAEYAAHRNKQIRGE